MSNSLPPIAGIRQVAVAVHDVARALVFYRDVLELPFLFRAGGLAFLDCGGVRLMLSVPESAELRPPGSILYFRVEDIESFHRVLVERGVAFVSGPQRIARLPDHDVWIAAFRDPEGNVLAAMSEIARGDAS